MASLTALPQCFEDRVRQRARTFAAEIGVDAIESLDEIGDLTPRVWPTRGRAEMCAAAKRAIAVNDAIAVSFIEHRTGSIALLRQCLAAGSTKRFRCDERLAFCEVGRPAGAPKLAALL